MRLRMLVASGALVALTAMSGCGGGGGNKVATLDGGGSSSSSSSSGDSKQTFQDAMVAYSGCMREHGVNMPDPKFTGDMSDGGPGFAVAIGPEDSGGEGAMPRPDDPTFKAAEAVCKPLLDAATKDLPKPSPEEMAKQRDQALAFAKCMREHGIDMPDPTFDDGGQISISVAGGADGAQGGPTGLKPGELDPKFEEAAKACQPEGGPMMGAGTVTSKAGG